MTSEAQIQANRQNAQKSTGPSTSEGKAIASKNATTHGLLSKELLIEGEKPSTFEAFYSLMMLSLKPEGAIESLLAEKVIYNAWGLKRVNLAESEFFAREIRKSSWGSNKKMDEAFETHPCRKLHNITRYETAIERQFYKALAELRATQSLRKKQNELASFGIFE